MIKRKLIVTVIFQILAGVLVLNAQEVDSDKALSTTIDNYLNAGVEHGFSGAVLVAKKGEIILNKGYGLANKEKKIKNTPSTVFDIGSNTKQFTAAAILKLEEFHKLNTTDSLSMFFDNLPEDKKNITIHQLLSHSAGLVDGIGRDFDHISEAAFFKKLFATELHFKPGSEYKYSNAGYSILARIIELVSNQDYEAFLNEKLFKPAGMEHTGYLLPKWDNNLLASGYSRNVFERGSMVTKYQEDGKVSWHLKGNGGINSTQEDMFKWYQALKNNTILSKVLFKKMTTAYIKRYEGAGAYGLGWGINLTANGTKRIAHNGANGAFFHSFIWLLEEDIVIIYATNTSSPKIEGVGHKIDKMIIWDDYQPEPIKKGIYFMVEDFIRNNDSEQSKQLLTVLLQEYRLDYEHPGILNRIGYTILESKKNLDWAVEIFKINTRIFPFEGNVWDSLGDAYIATNQKREAIDSFEKALELKTEFDCEWCEHSTEKLKELTKN